MSGRVARGGTAAAVAAGLLLALAAPGAGQGWPSDPWLEDPVDEATFSSYQQFFEYDAELPFEARTEETERREGVVVERLSYLSVPGERVTALFFRPDGGEWRTRPTLLQLHGGTGEGKDFSGYRRQARQFVRHGFNVLAIDLDHFGERDDGLLTTYTARDKHENLYNRPSVYLDWVAQTVKDAGRARDFLVAEKGVSPERIGLVGISRGAQLGMIVAGADDRFRAVALVMGGHFDAAERRHLPAACPANYVGRISPRPVFFVNGIYDQDYDRERSVEPLHRLAREPKTIRWAETGHTAPPQAIFEEMTTWLRERLAEGS